MVSNLLLRPSLLQSRALTPSTLMVNRGREKREQLLSKQLVSINQNIIAVGNNIQTVANALTTEDRVNTIRVRREKTRRLRSAEKETFGGAEKALESSVVRAIKAPINAITKTISGPLGSLKKALLLLFGGWLTDKLIKMFDEEGGTFTERLKKFGFEIVKGLGAAVGIMSVLDGNFFRIARIMGSLAFRIGKFLILAPFKLLKTLFKLRPGSGPKLKGPGKKPPKVERGKTRIKGGGNVKTRARLGRLFGRTLAGLGGALEYKSGREEGYDSGLAALKSLLVTGSAYGTGALVAKGLALTGVGLVLSLPAGAAAATGAATGASALFDQMFGQFKKEGQGTFELFDLEGNPMKDYELQIYEGGRFEVKKTGMFQNPFAAPIIDSGKILSGEQTINPDGKNAELLEAALRQVMYMSLDDTKEYETRRQSYLQVAQKAFGKLDIEPFDRQKTYSELVTGTQDPRKQSMVEGLIKSGFPADEASNIASLVFDSGDSASTAANVGTPTYVPVILTKNKENPLNDLARTIYGVRM